MHQREVHFANQINSQLQGDKDVDQIAAMAMIEVMPHNFSDWLSKKKKSNASLWSSVVLNAVDDATYARMFRKWLDTCAWAGMWL